MLKQPTKKTAGRKASSANASKFPLFRHQSGRWCKKVRQHFHYFGKVADDPEGQVAQQLWCDQKDDLLAGRPPRVNESELRINDLLNRFLTAKKDAADSAELSSRSFRDYKDVCKRIVETFPREWSVESLGPDDFARLRRELAKRYKSAEVLGNWIQRVRTVFLFGYKNELTAQPPRYGTMFARPTKKAIRKSESRVRANRGG